jgi:hypothetical protein
MRKVLFSLVLSGLSLLAFANPPKDLYEYYIVFAGSFRNDVVSLSINKQLVCNRYVIENTDPDKKGNLSIAQYENNINIAYNGKQITKSRIPVDFKLDLAITVNGKKKQFNINLKKGKIILIDFQKDPATNQKDLTIEQLQEPFILY